MVMLVGDGHVVRACISNKIVVSLREKSGFFREKKEDEMTILFIYSFTLLAAGQCRLIKGCCNNDVLTYLVFLDLS